jgi:hypothetical protein
MWSAGSPAWIDERNITFMNGADVIAEILKREGTEFLSCYPRNPVIDAAAAIGIRTILCRQERVGVGIADGYSRIRRGRKNGVFAAQQGPGIGLGRPYLAPPDVPAERVALLRKALADTMKDKGFMTDAGRMKLELDPITGEELTQLVNETINAHPDAVARARVLMPKKKSKKKKKEGRLIHRVPAWRNLPRRAGARTYGPCLAGRHSIALAIKGFSPARRSAGPKMRTAGGIPLIGAAGQQEDRTPCFRAKTTNA